MNERPQLEKKIALVPFAEAERAEQFGHALLEKLLSRVGDLQEKVVPRHNVCFLPHGNGWTFQMQHKDGFSPETGGFNKQSTEIAIHDERVLSNDLGVIQEIIEDLSQKMHSAFVERLLKEVDTTCARFDRITNISKGASVADGLLDSLADIHLGVSEDGTVSRPWMSLSPDMIERLNKELIFRATEIQHKAEAIWEKSQERARVQEAERLAKYDNQ